MEKVYKVAVFGSLPIATKILQYLMQQKNIQTEVVLGKKSLHNNDPWPETPCLAEFCEMNNIETKSMDELKEQYGKGALDLGVSCRFDKIIKKDVLDLFRKGIVNMHGGLLPEFGGLYSCNMSILFGAEKGGGTIHYIDEGIDTGDILRRCEFALTGEDTGYTVFQKTQTALYENMLEIIPKVLHGEIKATPAETLKQQGYPARYFNRQSINDYKEVRPDMPEEEIVRRVRAFDFPGYEPAYMVVQGRKIYLRVSS